MQIEFERKTKDCAGNNCSARYRVIGVPGGKVLIGKRLDEETRAQLGPIGEDEYAVWVPDDL
jgi:hypothetical protein